MAIPALILPGIADVLDLLRAAARRRPAARRVRARRAADGARAGALRADVRRPVAGGRGGLARRAAAHDRAPRSAACEALYIEAMDELLAKDLSFFHDNFAGSLTKRALGYARRFEDVFDVLCFSVSANLLPLVFVGVVLWSYSPLLIVVLLGDAGGDVRAGLPADPPAAAAGRRPRGGVERPRRARRRLDRQRRGGARLRARARRGADPRAQRAATTAPRRCGRGTTRTCASTRSRRRCTC